MEGVIPEDPFPVDSGTARFAVLEDSVTLYINGLPSSQLYLHDPEVLEFEYMCWILAATTATFRLDEPLRALHLGAGACALPRAILHRWPKSRHLAVEKDAALAQAVRQHLELPRSPLLRIRVADAAPTLQSRPPGSHHLIIRDAFDHTGNTPVELTGAQAAADVFAALRPDGLYLANCGDLAGLPRSRAEIRILGEQFPYVGLITEPSQLRGRRLGNVVLLARKEPFSPEVEDQLSRSLLRVTFPARLVAGPEALRWAGIDVSP